MLSMQSSPSLSIMKFPSKLGLDLEDDFELDFELELELDTVVSPKCLQRRDAIPDLDKDPEFLKFCKVNSGEE